jgi:hypothetical protein
MHPVLYQVNTRCTVQELEAPLGRRAGLDDLPDETLDRWAAQGFDYVWLLGVWQTGEMGRRLALQQAELCAQYRRVLPDLSDADFTGSVFAIHHYDVDQSLGGNDALARLRVKLAARGVRLVLDYVPNHVAIDHPWAYEHPERFVQGTEEDLLREPANYLVVPTRYGTRILAHGRDPNFLGWLDTLQLNYASESCRGAMIAELVRIASRCDGVRCDMAMLIEPDVFVHTWGRRAMPADGSEPALRPFWPEAIAAVRHLRPDFLFIAEVYWDMEWRLQQQGFDYTYDKRLYDRLEWGETRPVREHLLAEPVFQNRSLRFIENHDEKRATATFPWPMHHAASAIAMLVPGMAFLHDGQLEGKKAHVPMQVRRRPLEPIDPNVFAWYAALLACTRRPEVRRGVFTLWPCQMAWAANATWNQFVVFSWSLGERSLVVVVNYGPTRGQCYARIGLSGLRGRRFSLSDLLSEVRYERDGDTLTLPGLYLDVTAWGVHVFAMEPV